MIYIYFIWLYEITHVRFFSRFRVTHFDFQFHLCSRALPAGNGSRKKRFENKTLRMNVVPTKRYKLIVIDNRNSSMSDRCAVCTSYGNNISACMRAFGFFSAFAIAFVVFHNWVSNEHSVCWIPARTTSLPQLISAMKLKKI